ncbi:M30 family zinc metallopeptidase [Variovorax arabinosiphilus]|uniref:M30 family zinc metallopeptidase n=1 Tax=Variovorax arabinosiphilus TaxID=3053498 RepID=UPI002575BFF8|nr:MULTISPECIES: hemagglutinin [unclassified Variovorax]MDM0119622.1 hemagglutinin [Variovorax sp. J2L1-78]MDM0128466.1 hemagglutinin [Variovorax sp. J2L1-63]MDM0232166.1 hemagglutinin [Variovorax sp. J2R1-6]
MPCRTPNALFGAIASLAAAAILAACGGGGGGGEGGAAGTAGASAPPVAAIDTPSPLTAACTDCGAVDGSTYAGAGTGVWQVSNAGSLAKDFPLAIKGLTGQLVTLVFTNESAQEVAMPSLQILSSSTTLAPTLSKTMAGGGDSADAGTAFNADVANFNRDGFARLLSTPTAAAGVAAKLSALSAPTAPAATYTVGQQRTVYLLDRSQRTVRLAGQRATGDGTVVNVWVETSEIDPARVSATLSDRVRDAFAGAGGIYDMLVKVGGPLWGPHGHTELLPGSGQPIDIFLVNFDRNAQPYGMGGYFWGLNNFKTGAGQLAYSNESLSMYMDTETMYLDGERGLRQVVTALAHEGMHMQNFYRRSVSMGSQFAFDDWLEEMSALMMEDWASYALDTSHNAIRDARLPYYLNYRGSGSYNCELTRWDPMGTVCESYAVVGSFGGYLNRQFGLGFFQSVLRSTGLTDSAAVLEAAIKAQRPDSGIGQELRRFSSAAAGLVPLSAGVAGYSMPMRNDDGLQLVAMDPAALGESGRGLPAAVPSTLKGFASFPVSRFRLTGSYKETVRVPPGSTLTVVIR